MKILHMDGFDDGERSAFRVIIRKNILNSFDTILRACNQLGIDIQQENEVKGYRSTGYTQYTFNVNDISFTSC
jgi:hypothetical protein